MKRVTGDKLGDDIKWLSEIIPAFSVRFDENLIEDSRVPERISEIVAAIGVIRRATKENFGNVDQVIITNRLNSLEIALNDLFRSSRNSTTREIKLVLSNLQLVAHEMATRIDPNKGIG